MNYSVKSEEPSQITSRWDRAQKWELNFWRMSQEQKALKSLRRPLWKWPIRCLMQFTGLRDYNEMPIGNDWNDWWETQFLNYESLPKKIGNLLELGCGPHTNTRVIMKTHDVEHAVCSDPLFGEYLTLPRSWLRWAVRHGVVCGDDHPAENCPFASDYFDVVVMINVLEHTQDPDECVKSIFRTLAPGGYIILGNDTLPALLEGDPAIGHPHWFSNDWLDENVESSYDCILKKTLSPEQSRHPSEGAGCWLFIGRKPIS